MNDIHRLLAERAKTHGDFVHHARLSQIIKNDMRDGIRWRELSMYQRESLDMIANKIARILTGNPHFKDHWDDIAGYALLTSKQLNGL